RIIMHTAPRRSSVTNLRNGKTGQPARLQLLTSHGGKMHFRLDRDETTIGRKDDNGIVLTCTKISKRHAVVLRTSDGYFLKDLNSSNGVKVNGTLIAPGEYCLLIDGDVLTIGTNELTFFDDVTDATRRPSASEDQYLKLVTILPSERKYEETVTIRAEVEAVEHTHFRKISEVEDTVTLREDYEKLRLVHELSKVSPNDLTQLLLKSLDLIFEILPVDRGVVLLVDQNTGILSPHKVKLREGKATEQLREILLSSTILSKVTTSRKCLITSDACEDPDLGKAASVKVGQIRSVICVPLIAHNRVHGILHLDSRNRINSFSPKDLSLVQAISNQTAVAIENSILMKVSEDKVRQTEQLGRFLPPHVVSKMTQDPSFTFKKSGRLTTGTIVFADIRGFTNLSEKSGPGEVVNLLNDYFERLVKIVFKYDGIVDKYIGDALMADFGTLETEIDDTDTEFRAVCATLEFKQAIDEINAERTRLHKEPIAIGVGVNTGELLAGYIGSQRRLEYTCIGDTVNTSSRICSMADINQVLISESTYERVKTRVDARPVGLRQFKGKQKEVMVYEAISVI
ncbi:nucleotide cyclase, partial [Blyttiomyces helicus]